MYKIDIIILELNEILHYYINFFIKIDIYICMYIIYFIYNFNNDRIPR